MFFRTSSINITEHLNIRSDVNYIAQKYNHIGKEEESIMRIRLLINTFYITGDSIKVTSGKEVLFL